MKNAISIQTQEYSSHVASEIYYHPKGYSARISVSNYVPHKYTLLIRDKAVLSSSQEIDEYAGFISFLKKAVEIISKKQYVSMQVLSTTLRHLSEKTY